MKWLNEPPNWNVENNTIEVTSTPNIDLGVAYRVTNYVSLIDPAIFLSSFLSIPTARSNSSIDELYAVGKNLIDFSIQVVVGV